MLPLNADVLALPALIYSQGKIFSDKKYLEAIKRHEKKVMGVGISLGASGNVVNMPEFGT